jgi:hypothetical protein
MSETRARRAHTAPLSRASVPPIQSDSVLCSISYPAPTLPTDARPPQDEGQVARSFSLPRQTLTGAQIAVEGCCHGQLDAIYARVRALEQQHGYAVDALLVCGDFQATRNAQDLGCMAVPDKYKKLGDFYKCARTRA